MNDEGEARLYDMTANTVADYAGSVILQVLGMLLHNKVISVADMQQLGRRLVADADEPKVDRDESAAMLIRELGKALASMSEEPPEV